VLEAAHGEDAKRLITQRGVKKVDLLLTDMVMPEISGRHVANWLRQISPQTKVIFISVTWRNRSIPMTGANPA
jgi:YesN/AraC family two-component response regulator